MGIFKNFFSHKEINASVLCLQGVYIKSDKVYGNAAVIGDKFITAAHVVKNGRSVYSGGHNLGQPLFMQYDEDRPADGLFHDCAVYDYPEPNNDLKSVLDLPKIGDVVENHSVKHRNEVDVPFITKGTVTMIVGNFIFCEMQEPLGEGQSGSPIIKDGLVYGILHGGLDGRLCAFQSIQSINQVLLAKCDKTPNTFEKQTVTP